MKDQENTFVPRIKISQKEINARVYHRHKNKGECPRCGKTLDREGHYCSKCLEKVREYHRENRRFYAEHHLCTECGKVKVPGNERVCPECRDKNEHWRKPLTEEQKIRYSYKFKKRQNSLYQQRSEQGICTRCGKRKAMPGKKKCGICLAKDAEMHRKIYMDRPNVKEYRKKTICAISVEIPLMWIQVSYVKGVTRGVEKMGKREGQGTAIGRKRTI